MVTKVAILVVAAVLPAMLARPDGGGGYKQPDGYFMYLNVPRPKEYEAGFNRGNDKHSISRFEQVKDHRFRTRVKWSDAHDGYGEHYFEYNHGPKHPEPVYHEPVYHEPVHHPHHDIHHKPAYSGQEPVVVNAPHGAAQGGEDGGDWGEALYKPSALGGGDIFLAEQQ